MENAYANETNKIFMNETKEIIQDEISLADIIRVILKGKWLIGVLVIIAVIGTYSYYRFLARSSAKFKLLFLLISRVLRRDLTSW